MADTICKHGSTSCGWCHDMSGALFPEATTSQAEAQAPTTAASVLTEDDVRAALEPYLRKLPNELAVLPGVVVSLLTSTVGAPAPAPTMPTREQIDECVRTTLIDGLVIADCGCDAFYVGNNPEFVDALVKDLVPSILALIAKGDTP